MQQTANKLRWWLGINSAIAVMLVSLIPQANFWRVRGQHWQGAYYSYHPDEYPYSAYLNALIHGKPRRNDPYSGKMDQPGSPLPESVLSIQFVPAYSIALAARLFRIPASTAFILLTPISAFVSGLALFWFAGKLTGDDRLAAAAVPFVLCLGSLARGQFLVRHLGGLDTPTIPLPFLRRYDPAFPFPFFLLFCGLLWIILNTKNRRSAVYSAIAAGLTFGVLLFSYYFLWTAAVTLLITVTITWAVARPEDYRESLRYLGIVTLLCMFALIPYAILLSHRAPDVDSFQALVFSRRPDLFRPPMILGLMLAVMIFIVRRRLVSGQNRAVLFTAALALSPLLMFNQQVLTGRSLQPIHYEQFIANYVSLIALLLTGGVVWSVFIKRHNSIALVFLVCVSLLALSRGVLEARFAASRAVLRSTNVDELVPAARRLTEMAQQRDESGPTGVVLALCPTLLCADALPTFTSQPVLWAIHSFSFSALTAKESKERYFEHLYYAGVDLRKLPSSSYDRVLFRYVMFGWGRALPGLSVNWRPITEAEELAALEEYESFVASFNRERATSPTLAFVVVPANVAPDFSRIDQWYERGPAEETGGYVIYPVKLRP